MAEPENSGASAGPEPRKRRPAGRPFQPGRSGNPGGRPKSDLGQRIRAATKDGALITDVLVAIVRASDEDVGDKGPLRGETPKLGERIDAAKLLAERGWGKAVQPLEHSGPDGQPLVVEVVNYAGGGES